MDFNEKNQQIEELQKALSDAHMYLYEERQNVLQLTAENDALRVQEMEDRKRISHLLTLTQPHIDTTTFITDTNEQSSIINNNENDKSNIETSSNIIAPSSSSLSKKKKIIKVKYINQQLV